MLRFDNRWRRELPGDPLTLNQPRPVQGASWSAVMPTPVSAPRLLACSHDMASRLGLDEATLYSPQLVAVLAGNALLPGMEPYATPYGGHQFGQWAGQLGDGRAIMLGEVVTEDGQRWEMQLKGAGPTPFARRADGRAVLRSSLREFLCSEAMHHLGIPTTRALSLVASGDSVVRDMFYSGQPQAEPGAIVCRLAPSFTRIGHFELPAARGDTALLRQLTRFTIARDFPELATIADEEERLTHWFSTVCTRTAELMARWMQVGFVHGVMNTDNLSILGLTIDYGPYGWIDAMDAEWTPNTTDSSQRRYAFGRQPAVAQWNLECLAHAIAPLLSSPEALIAGIDAYRTRYDQASQQGLQRKFGWQQPHTGDEALIERWYGLLQDAELDLTIAFRQLGELDLHNPTTDGLAAAAYSTDRWQLYLPALERWLAEYVQRSRSDWPGLSEDGAARRSAMHAVNPRYVLRNYLAQQAIDAASDGDTRLLHELLDTLRHPYVEQPERSAFAARRPEWARHRPGCSMLSCSS